MSYLSNVTALGGITRDAEGRQVGDSFVVNFSLAVDSGQKYTRKEREELGIEDANATVTQYFRCSAWGGWAKWMFENGRLTKGAQVLVEGKIQVDARTGNPRIWDSGDKQGASQELRLSWGKDGLLPVGRNEGGASTAREDSFDDDEDDDIPF